MLAVAAVDDDTAKVYDRRLPRSRRPSLPSAASRIRKQKHRLLAIEPGEPDIEGAVRAGLIACANGAVNPPSPGMCLDGIARWADELDKGWPKFPPGKHRDGALREIRAATRDGLLRHLQARGLREAGLDERGDANRATGARMGGAAGRRRPRRARCAHCMPRRSKPSRS